MKTTVYISATFDAWFHGPRDIRAKARIAVRLDRMADGNFGDVKPVGHGISDAAGRLRTRLPGVLHATRSGSRGGLAGGDKSTQSTDIGLARRMANDWERES